MKVKVKLVSMPGHQPAGFDEFGNALLTLNEETTVAGLIAQLKLSNLETYMVLVNSETVPPGDQPTRVLNDGDEAAIFPPMEGG